MATASVLLDDAYLIPDEERAQPRERETYPALIRRLSHQSVVKHFDAYADIAWDSEEFRIDPDDARWELSADDPLGATAWYQSQAPSVRARIGLHYYASLMKIGLQFENVLERGLLEYALELPNGSPEFRYAYHEIIEESQHSLMFQEFVNRSGLDVPGLPPHLRLGTRLIVRLARVFPELFFMFVLGGEDPIDHTQRSMLRNLKNVHPLLRRIMQIHVTEEARHLCFARHFLRQRGAKMSRWRKLLLGIRTPLLLNRMAKLMMQPPDLVIRTHKIPPAVIREAYTDNPMHRTGVVEALKKVRELCVEMDLVNPISLRLWKRFGLWQ